MALNLKFGNVVNKRISTSNDFISHMLEHIFWRMGCEVELEFDNSDWKNLGMLLGEKISLLSTPNLKESISLGMIDDGAAIIRMYKNNRPKVSFTAINGIDLKLFLKSRCEQIENSKPLEAILFGMCSRLGFSLDIQIIAHNDPHHTWEGIFRGIGLCLKDIYFIKSKLDLAKELSKNEVNVSSGDISILERSFFSARVRRGTAETGVEVYVNFLEKAKESKFNIEVDKSIEKEVKDVPKILNIIASNAEFRLDVKFVSKKLSSSHVVLEDIGLVLGRALFEIIKIRFDKIGANGSGYSFLNFSDYKLQKSIVALSIEGRKFIELIAPDSDIRSLNKNFILYKNVFDLRSEDLDDFLDGFAGGLNSSLLIYLKTLKNPSVSWLEIFSGLGKSIHMTFELNTNRKGLPPGVKATLA